VEQTTDPNEFPAHKSQENAKNRKSKPVNAIQTVDAHV
jgi:hypothetical protein